MINNNRNKIKFSYKSISFNNNLNIKNIKPHYINNSSNPNKTKKSLISKMKLIKNSKKDIINLKSSKILKKEEKATKQSIGVNTSKNSEKIKIINDKENSFDNFEKSNQNQNQK